MRKNEKQTLLPEILRGGGTFFTNYEEKFPAHRKGTSGIPLEEEEAKL